MMSELLHNPCQSRSATSRPCCRPRRKAATFRLCSRLSPVPVFAESEEVTDEPPREMTKADMQREQIIRALRRNNGRRREAAAELFMSERTLYRKIKELGIEEKFADDPPRIVRRSALKITGSEPE